MTSPIKPPGGGKPASPGASAPSPGESFQKSLDGVQETNSAAATGAPALVEQLVADLKAGRIDGPAAMDRLVQDALEGPMAAGLTPRGRDELEAFLRESFAQDPALAQLLQDLDS